MLVVPHEGTWIEITSLEADDPADRVVPHEGTWIEIDGIRSFGFRYTSFPTRERGLKWLNNGKILDGDKSFPTRERGLK